MSFFSKPKVVLWPKEKTLEVYINLKENNHLTLDINLWQENTQQEIDALVQYLKKNKVQSASVLIPDDVALTKSFIYDTKIDQIDKKEVIGLAESFVSFKIDSDYLEYKLIQDTDKTIIQSTILEKDKIIALKNNLDKLAINITNFDSVSASIAKVLSSIYPSQFFLIYPLNDKEYTLLLSKDKTVYLTNNFKGPSLDIQKTINYSKLYFATPAKKVYYPDNKEIEIVTSSEIEKTAYNENQIAQNLNQTSNFPIPVLAHFSDIIKKSSVKKSETKNMENKKNILPIIAVIIFTAALVSFILYFIFNRNKNNDLSNDLMNGSPTSVLQQEPTQAPTPTLAEIDKDIAIQVLNATDINGQAATLKAVLVDLGFEDVAVGNASKNSDINTVELKSTLTGAADYFEAKLETDFPAATYSEDLDEDSKYDIVFTIGTDLSENDVEDEDEVNLTSTEVEEEDDEDATPTEAEEEEEI